MSPFPFSHALVRKLSLIAISIVFVTVALVWATGQRAGTSASNVRTSLSSFAAIATGNTTSADLSLAAVCDPAPIVTNNSDSGSGSLRDAIANACDGGNITFDMTQVVSPINVTSAELSINKNLVIQGPGANLLSVSGNNAGRIFNIQSGQTVNIGDLTLANGRATASPGGAGVLNNGTLTLTNCNLYGNTSTLTGGAITNNGTSLTLTNCNLGGTGAGQPNSGTSGAGIYNNTGTLNMTGGSIKGNTGGPAATTNNGAVTFTSVAMTNNTSNTSGALLTNDGSTTLTSCLVANNTGVGGGGVGVFGLGPVNINNTTISGNVSSALGGGLFVTNNGNATLTNVTITNNRSGSPGGGISQEFSSVVTLQNTIVAGNFFGASPSTTADDIGGHVSASSSFNLIGTGGSGGLSNGVNDNKVGIANPGLGALTNNGGSTQTHALLSASPALDAASNTLASNAGLTNDQRGAGFVRSMDGPDADTTATVDIGAFEAQITVEDIADKSTNEDTQLQFAFNVSGTITSATASSSNASLVPNNAANITVTGSGSTRTLTINPAANLNGTSTITVTVSDNNGQSMTDTFLLTVNPINDAPSFTKGADQAASEDAGAQTVVGWATSLSRGPVDESGQTLTFQVTGNTNAALFSSGPAISAAGTLTYTPAANANGSATITINLKDNGGTANGGNDTSASQTFVITVNPVNDAPSFTKGANPTANEDSGAQTIANWATNIAAGPADEAAQTLTFQIVSNGNPSIFSVAPAISANGTLTYTPAANANGSSVITINLKDNGGTANGGVDTSASQTFTIFVNPVNDAPSFTKGADQTVNNNAGAQTVTNWATNISAGPGDESSQTLTFQVTNNTNPTLFAVAPAISSSGTLTYRPANNQGGTATITINLKDNGGTANGALDTSASQTFTITVVPIGGFVNFVSSTSNTTEDSGSTTVNVVRSGNTSLAVMVNYTTNADAGIPCSTANGVASPKCDFTTALGTLNFAAGETSKSITILISQDSFVEGPETITLTLSGPTNGAALGTPSSMTVTIADDASEPSTNIIDDASTFVRMHYHDFLNREADQSGLNFWTGQMTNCGSPDLLVCRVNVSGAFFLSIEFQQTGYLVERMYKTGYGDATGTSQIGGSHQIFVPVVRANEFLADTQRVGRGVVVNEPGWETVLENNKQAYALEFVQTTRFITAFPTTRTPAQFVDQLNSNAGNALSASERTTAIYLFGNAANTTNINARAQALRQVAEDTDLYNAEFNRAFVLAEYIGYLRRNPNDAPESTLDYTGYDFWLGKLNQFNGDYITAEMVKAFISSSEYRQRFGP